MAIGKVNQKILWTKERISLLEQYYLEYIDIGNLFTKKGTQAHVLRVTPILLEGTRSEIVMRQKELEILTQEYEKLIKDLMVKRGEVKAVEKIKEKHFELYKGLKKKKEQKTLDEIVATNYLRQKNDQKRP